VSCFPGVSLTPASECVSKIAQNFCKPFNHLPGTAGWTRTTDLLIHSQETSISWAFLNIP
jgi:hypothetical protein